MNREALVTCKGLEDFVDQLPANKAYEVYLKRRWIGMVMWWHERSTGAKWKFFLLRDVVIPGGVMLPPSRP